MGSVGPDYEYGGAGEAVNFERAVNDFREMEAATIRVMIVLRDQFSPALREVVEKLRRLHWRMWWAEWGTDGAKRRTALVVVER